MRNVFEQYSQAENQLTHALFSALEHDRQLLRSFLSEVCQVIPPCPPSELRLSVQHYPFAQGYTETEVESRNVPDAWIFSDDGWALVFEAKITAVLTTKQLAGHQRISKRLGFEEMCFFTIVGEPTAKSFAGWTQLSWREIYTWLRTCSEADGISDWARITADFFEILEAKMLEDDKLGSSELTAFTGFLGGEDNYSYLLAKSKLKQAMRELRANQLLIDELGMDPDIPGRSAITGKADERVWDFLSLSSPYNTTSFTKFVHLTLGISPNTVEAMVTVPNGIATIPRNAIKSLGLVGFKQVANKILEQLRPVLAKEPNAVPIMRAVQRRYPSQRSVPFLDARIEFDLRTAFDGNGPKQQEQWIDALFDAFQNKKSNYQFQVGVEFDHAKCETMQNGKALDLLAQSWLACKPLIDIARA